MYKKLVLILSLLLIASGAVGNYYYHRYQQLAKQQPDEVDKITERLAQFVQLPSEKPSLAIVTDTTKLSNSGLASKAENGDRILVFANAGWAILYRPSTQRLIDTYPISSTTSNLSNLPTPSASLSPSPSSKARN